MNVRIDEKSLRFKISEEELKVLLSGQLLQAKLDVMDRGFLVVIEPRAVEKAMNVELLQSQDGVGVRLWLSQQKVQELSEMGRSRAGLKETIGQVSVSLQVDVRADSRKVGKR